jgi:AGCS family alanine or glycine:cation symporter
MCGIYISACLWVILSHAPQVPGICVLIIRSAFVPEAVYGGFLGALVIGFQRAAFSNEAGIGSAAIAHSAAKTKYPVREGVVALLEPFIDTVVVCTMTAMVMLITGAYNNPNYLEYINNNEGAALTAAAFAGEVSWFPYVLAVSVVLFAYSTMISWSYYGERCWTYLFGEKYSRLYRIIFVVVVFLGSVMSSTAILDFSDFMILGMAFPNILGLYILSGEVMEQLREYMRLRRSGCFEKEVRGEESR